MEISKPTVDNISEILIKIIEFTQARQKILTENLNHFNRQDFVPRDLAVGEFSQLLHKAVDEHISNSKISLCDTVNIKFKVNGTFEATPIADAQALTLLKENLEKYIDLQTDKLLENAINQRFAAEILKQKQKMIPVTQD